VEGLKTFVRSAPLFQFRIPRPRRGFAGCIWFLARNPPRAGEVTFPPPNPQIDFSLTLFFRFFPPSLILAFFLEPAPGSQITSKALNLLTTPRTIFSYFESARHSSSETGRREERPSNVYSSYLPFSTSPTGAPRRRSERGSNNPPPGQNQRLNPRVGVFGTTKGPPPPFSPLFSPSLKNPHGHPLFSPPPTQQQFSPPPLIWFESLSHFPRGTPAAVSLCESFSA